jgi:hypothetical protein
MNRQRTALNKNLPKLRAFAMFIDQHQQRPARAHTGFRTSMIYECARIFLHFLETNQSNEPRQSLSLIKEIKMYRSFFLLSNEASTNLFLHL